MTRKIFHFIISGILGSFLVHHPTFAAGNSAKPPQTYTLQLVWISGTLDPPEFIFVINGVAFKSVDALKKFLSDVPEGSTLEWNPGCKRMEGQPLLTSEKEMDEFKKFLKKEKINFMLHPGG